MHAIGVVRSDGSDARLLVHHYDVNPIYFADPFAQSSPDGKVVIFNSNMAGSGRYDLFVAEVPLRCSHRIESCDGARGHYSPGPSFLQGLLALPRSRAASIALLVPPVSR